MNLRELPAPIGRGLSGFLWRLVSVPDVIRLSVVAPFMGHYRLDKSSNYIWL